MPDTPRDIIERSLPADLPAMLEPETVARLLGTTTGTLKKNRCLRRGLDFVKDGGLVTYPKELVIQRLVEKYVAAKPAYGDSSKGAGSTPGSSRTTRQ